MRIKRTVQNRLLAAAFTLPEVLIGMGVAAIALLALYGGFTYGFTVIDLTRQNLRATQIMLERMEAIRLFRWEQINQQEYVNGEKWLMVPEFTVNYDIDPAITNTVVYHCKVTAEQVKGDLATASYAPDLRLITITLDWHTGSIARTRTMTTLVARQGLQTYEY